MLPDVRLDSLLFTVIYDLGANLAATLEDVGVDHVVGLRILSGSSAFTIAGLSAHRTGGHKCGLQVLREGCKRLPRIGFALGYGDVQREIIRLAKENQLDLLVLGGHGHRGVADIPAGTAVGISAALLLGGWLLYDQLCKRLGFAHERWLAIRLPHSGVPRPRPMEQRDFGQRLILLDT